MEIKLYPPPHLQDEKITLINFGKEVPPKKWSSNLCVVWTHTHRLVGFTSDTARDAIREKKPFFIHHVGTWISQVGFVQQGGQIRVQSAQTIIKYDNLAPLQSLLITKPDAFSLAPDMGEDLCDWLVSAYLTCFDPSELQIVGANQLPKPGQKH